MKRYFGVVCIFLMVIGLSIPIAFAEESQKKMTILFTHDLHDHFLPSNVNVNEKLLSLGGYARLQSAINIEKKMNPNLLLVDAGDFSMGTLFQSVYASDAPELRIMGQMGYDVVTLGNHEFDFRAKGLTESLEVAKKSGDKLPQIVTSNLTFPRDKKGRLTSSLTNLQQAMQNYGVQDYTVIERNGVKVGIFGLMGKDAASNAPKSEVEFTNAVENAKRIVNSLKQKEKVDLIICLSHMGTSSDRTRSEDELLAKKVPEINLVISAHTHTKLIEPIMVGKTIIGSCGEYGENLGVINISQDSGDSWRLNNYNLKEINDSLSSDLDITKTIDKFKRIVQEKYLKNFGVKFDDILAHTSYNFVPTSEIGKKHAEDTLGNLISDAYIYAVKKAEGVNYDPVTVALVPSGTIRGSFVKGDITVADAFSVSSLGIGPDNISGYPLISVYLTGKELRTACEVDASIAPIMNTAQLYMSGLNFTFNPNRLIFNKVTNTSMQKPDGTLEEINNTKLYRVVAGLYSAQMLSVVSEKSFGLLSIVPKRKDGTPITDFEAQIITDTTSGHNNEVKEWLAIAEYLKSSDQANGVPQVPQYYIETHGRKNVDNSHNVLAIIGSPNSIALAIYAILLLVMVLIALALILILTRKKRKDRRIAKKGANDITEIV